MKKFFEQHWAKISAALVAALVAFLSAIFASCSSVQRIQVKQQQGEQQQETTIESDTKLKDFSLNFYYYGNNRTAAQAICTNVRR